MVTTFNGEKVKYSKLSENLGKIKKIPETSPKLPKAKITSTLSKKIRIEV